LRHTVGESLGDIATHVLHPLAPEEPVYNPRTDIRESKANYYIEIEFPGMEGKEHLELKWINARTLFVETKLERPEILEEQPAQEGEAPPPEDSTTTKKDQEPKHGEPVLTVRERQIGVFARAFSFATEVDHEKLQATLHAGLLRIKVPKKDVEEVKKEFKKIDVKSAGT
jgi:HSP20 family molecular chaperone IbpA